jgi:hypothetical protein
MKPRGVYITNQGRALIAKLLALHTLTLSRVTVGRGDIPDDSDPATFTGLIEPVADATSNEPSYKVDTMMMTVEYRNDLNGGLAEGFWLTEYGVFALDPDVGEILFVYGALGDYPEWVSAAGSGGIDVRRYPFSVTIGQGVDIEVLYNPGSFMTAEDVAEYIDANSNIEMSDGDIPSAGVKLHMRVVGNAPGYQSQGGA